VDGPPAMGAPTMRTLKSLNANRSIMAPTLGRRSQAG